MNANEKYTNPKDIIGSDKVPLSLFPAAAVEQGSLAMLDGALKYGRDNFRVAGVRSSIYVDAMLRHLYAWNNGEDNAPDSGVNHLGHVLACAAIILDAQAQGKLNDDRKPFQDVGASFRLSESAVKDMKKKHADKNPKHYTIWDVPPSVTALEEEDAPPPPYTINYGGTMAGNEECPVCGDYMIYDAERRIEECGSPKCGYARFVP